MTVMRCEAPRTGDIPENAVVVFDPSPGPQTSNAYGRFSGVVLDDGNQVIATVRRNSVSTDPSKIGSVMLPVDLRKNGSQSVYDYYSVAKPLPLADYLATEHDRTALPITSDLDVKLKLLVQNPNFLKTLTEAGKGK